MQLTIRHHARTGLGRSAFAWSNGRRTGLAQNIEQACKMLPHDVAYPAFANALNALRPGWTFTDDGISGPGGARVLLAQRHSSSTDGHVDVQFLHEHAPVGSARLWDCVSGLGPTAEARAHFAAHLWAQTTAAACLELAYSGRGEFADHYHGSEPNAFTDWHVVAGGIIGFGQGESAATLQQWWLANPVLPTLARALAGSLDVSGAPHGIKILLGGDRIAEVRLNGECHSQASQALGSLGWPTLEPSGFVRSYIIALHPERAS
jgi:hypothetical protein